MEKDSAFGRLRGVLATALTVALVVSSNTLCWAQAPQLTPSNGLNGKFLAPISAPISGHTLISNRSDFNKIRNNLSGLYRLANDIDLGGFAWVPIGDLATPFTGEFDGAGFVVRNFKVSTSADYAGFFGYNTGVIRNLGIEKADIKSTSPSTTYVGGIAGYNYGVAPGGQNGGVIHNCYNEGTVSFPSTDNSYVGGIAGYNDQGSIIDSYNTGSISTASHSPTATAFATYAGGIAGGGTVSSIIDKCYNTANVSAASTINASSYAGGIVGRSLGKVSVSTNSGVVTASTSNTSTVAYAGGIAGLMSSTIDTISNCSNSGAISAYSYSNTSSNAGGITGGIISGSVRESFNTGDVSALSNSAFSNSANAGGITGHIQSGSINECYNEGEIKSNTSSVTINISRSGGIAGQNNGGTISNSYNTALISATSGTSNGGSGYAGGIVGENLSGSVNECYSVGDVHTTSFSPLLGGVVGFTNLGPASIVNTYWCVDSVQKIGNAVLSNVNKIGIGSAVADWSVLLQTADLVSAANYAGFGFVFDIPAGPWDISPLINNGMPHLFKVQSNTPDTSAEPTYAIALSPSSDFTFPSNVPGYVAPTHSVTVTNNGNRMTGLLNIALSGADAASFVLGATSINSIAVGGTDSFSVSPISGLGIGSYTATVTISNSNGISESFDVHFQVMRGPVLSVGTVSAMNGNTVVLPVTITDNPGFASIAFDLSFNRSKLTPISVTLGSTLPTTFSLTPNLNAPAGGVKVVLHDASDYYANGEIVLVTFQIHTAVLPDTIPVSLTLTSASNANSTFINFSTAPGVVNVISFVIGDLNGGNDLNGIDVVLLAQYLAELQPTKNNIDSSTTLRAASDVNADGKIDSRDLVRLARFVAYGSPPEPPLGS